MTKNLIKNLLIKYWRKEFEEPLIREMFKFGIQKAKFERKNMLSISEIEERSKTLIGAVDVSIEKWEFLYDYVVYNHFKNFEEVWVFGDYCGLCIYRVWLTAKRQNVWRCWGCPLNNNGLCCDEWADCYAAFKKRSGGDFLYATRKLIDKLKQIKTDLEKKEREKQMTTQKEVEQAYKVLQESSGIQVGDTVKILRTPKERELGFYWYVGVEKERMIGNTYTVDSVDPYFIRVNGRGFNIFCVEIVEKAVPKIEVDIKINGVTSKLSDISEETLRNIWRNSYEIK